MMSELPEQESDFEQKPSLERKTDTEALYTDDDGKKRLIEIDSVDELEEKSHRTT